MWEGEGGSGGTEYTHTHTHTRFICTVVWQKPTQNCKTIFQQLKKISEIFYRRGNGEHESGQDISRPHD